MRRKSPTTVEELADHLNLEPEHVPLLRLALTHRSQANGAATDNERLEFLGDSILGMLANEYLYEQFPEASEGQLTRMKANVVSEASLARPAQGLGLGRILDMARAEEAMGGRDRSSTLADTFEAVLAAIYLNAGLDPARRFVREYLIPEVDLMRAWDYKSTLQELLQAKYNSAPRYKIISEAGPAHAREFIAEVYLGDLLLGTGRGGSKKQAEQVAAAEALELLHTQPKKPRRSRKPARPTPAPPGATGDPLPPEIPVLAAPEPAAAVAEAPKRARRSRKTAVTEGEAPAPGAEARSPDTATAPAGALGTTEEAFPAAEPPARRARKPRASAPATAAEGGPFTAAADAESAEKGLKKERKPRARNAEGKAQPSPVPTLPESAAVIPSAPEAAPEPVEAPSRRRTARKRSVAEEIAAQDTEAPSRRRGSRKTVAVSENGPVLPAEAPQLPAAPPRRSRKKAAAEPAEEA